jgi:hypothetical protein
MVAGGDRQLAIKIRDELCHCLGNLTLTGYNSQLSNLPLDQKQDKKAKDGKYIGFKNGLALNEDIKNIPAWNKELIEARTSKLVDQALRAFGL